MLPERSERRLPLCSGHNGSPPVTSPPNDPTRSRCAAPFVSAFVVFQGCLALLSAGDAGGTVDTVSDSYSTFGRLLSVRSNGSAALPGGNKQVNGRPWLPMIALSLVFKPPSALPIRRSLPLYEAHAGRRSVGLQVGGVDHDRLSADQTTLPTSIGMKTPSSEKRFRRVSSFLCGP